MKVALIQMKVAQENDRNIEIACQRIAEAAKQGADLVMLPEMFCCPYQTKNFPIYAQPEGGPNCQALSQVAAQNGIYLVAGSMPEVEDGKIYNTSYVYGRNGEQLAKHRKVHLFDVDIQGGQRFMESETLTPGQDITTFDTEFGKMGLVICFDFRFPEMGRLMALQGARVLFVPAAFNMTTGPAHWELLFRSRALDNQLYTVGTAPARDLQSSYHSYGNSIIASPWGDVEARLDEQEGILYHDLKLERIETV
ncbi:MAG: carbon-nitrogen hydrolase family protein, partial [Angelakisella sp.]